MRYYLVYEYDMEGRRPLDKAAGVVLAATRTDARRIAREKRIITEGPIEVIPTTPNEQRKECAKQHAKYRAAVDMHTAMEEGKDFSCKTGKA